MKVYVFYYPDGGFGLKGADKIFKTEEAAIAYQKEHPVGCDEFTWYEELNLDLDNDLMLDLDAKY